LKLEKLFNSISPEESLEYRKRETGLMALLGTRNFYIGNLDLALDYHQKSLLLCENFFKF
ncbi:MAG: hypothetical protein ACFFB6_09330, partial [Promethearchaeota archaeon]